MTGRIRSWSSLAKRVNVTFVARLILSTGIALTIWAARPLWGSLWRVLSDWWAATLAGVSLTVAVLLFAIGERRKPAESEQPTAAEALRSLSSRSIALGAVTLLTVGVTAAVLLLDTSSGPGAAERLEAIKTAATLVAGTGGAAALLLAARRQRSTELTLLHQQRVSQSTEHDAAERRLTDLYLKAVEQLGSPQAAVRHGGLYALERVAQDNPHQRQTVVNVICAYLRGSPITSRAHSPGHRKSGIRRPGTASADALSAKPDERRQEREVQLTAQRIIQAHLRVETEKFWPDIDVDLTGATLIELDLTGCRLRTATFTDATLLGDTKFREARFDGRVSFTGTQFAGELNFDGAEFFDESRFEAAIFHRYSTFSRACFHRRTWFIGATFRMFSSFDHANFDAGANFFKSHFGERFTLTQAEFGDDANFIECKFDKSTSFTDTKFSGATFQRSHFRDSAFFTNTSFTEYAQFEEAKFFSLTNFAKITFTKSPGLTGVAFTYRRPPELAEQVDAPPPSP
ncbi:pentapeptide repeat-containing protein [Amycolatopsis sp. NPDC005961]|uniref:pentapeptide repeat-containing protein n=1 Tax=Amycolatopsis sp. NPDC005961 TaxID=3156720 RepID=UPI0033CF3809